MATDAIAGQEPPKRKCFRYESSLTPGPALDSLQRVFPRWPPLIG